MRRLWISIVLLLGAKAEMPSDANIEAVAAAWLANLLSLGSFTPLVPSKPGTTVTLRYIGLTPAPAEVMVRRPVPASLWP